ncbi:hypothetical protein [Clostridium sp. Marseille-P299]|uniref:hypothetical protein n=1 Tax=Clostridium sp. Marseille-P299 TaxID=1805477 RepID=UPI00082D2428|nr:hypothetical protein [Clostridium sp. Marseille-P299]
MQVIMETAFDIIYLITVVTLGIIMIQKSNGKKQYLLFGIMAVILGAGDAFHLVPRVVALCTTGLEDYVFALGIGKFITSITMTIFYILLYYVWRLRYEIEGKNGITCMIYILAISRIILCLFPQNAWTNANAPFRWGIYRNIPFTLLGILIIILFYKSAKERNDKQFRFMWLTIVLSFVFYLLVVLFVDRIPVMGMLMIPKTCAYVWTVFIGFNSMRSGR